MFDIRRLTQLLQIIAQAHPFYEAQRELGFFAACQQLQHLTDGHLWGKAIGTSLKMREFWLQAQQPLENARTVYHLVGIQLVAQRQATGPRFQRKDSIFFNQQRAIRHLTHLPHTDASGNAETNQYQQNKA